MDIPEEVASWRNWGSTGSTIISESIPLESTWLLIAGENGKKVKDDNNKNEKDKKDKRGIYVRQKNTGKDKDQDKAKKNVERKNVKDKSYNNKNDNNNGNNVNNSNNVNDSNNRGAAVNKYRGAQRSAQHK